MSFPRVTVVGLGLVGGSLALALKRSLPGSRVLGVDRTSVVEAAIQRGVVDDGEPDVQRSVESADLVVLATPVSVILDHLALIGSRLRPGTVVTDVGSTKRRVLERAHALPAEVAFIGGHPLAGKATSGLERAESDLFQGAPWCLVPRRGTEDAAVERLAALVRAVGALPVHMEAEDHDRAVALVSHLPQIVALLLTRQAASVDGALDVVGPAFRGVSRLAESPFSVWKDIFETNADMIREALARFGSDLEDAGRRLPDLEPDFLAARAGWTRLRRP